MVIERSFGDFANLTDLIDGNVLKTLFLEKVQRHFAYQTFGIFGFYLKNWTYVTQFAYSPDPAINNVITT